MNERRRSLRGRLYFHRNGRTWHPCRIVDASYEGARIIVDNPNGIPDEIVLYIPKRKSSRVPACDGATVKEWGSRYLKSGPRQTNVCDALARH
jgi:hypothetical protein